MPFTPDASTQPAPTKRGGFTPDEAGMPAARQPDTSLAQVIGVANRAISPYATAAGAGALAGAPFGGVGAIPGAAMGVAALGLGDIGTSAYNLGARYFGGKRVPLPSETIQNMYGSVGIGREPQTPGQQVLANTLAAATGAGAQAKALNALAPYMRGPVTQGVARELGVQPGVQAVAGGASAAAPSILETQGVTDPFTLALSSVAGGAAGAKGVSMARRGEQAITNTAKRISDVVTGQPAASVDELKMAANAAYDKAKASGITFTPKSYSDMVDTVNTTLKQEGFDPDLSDKIAKVVNTLEKRRGAPQSLTELDNLRKIVSGLKLDSDPNTRRLAGEIVDTIDDYVTKSGSNAVTSGAPEGITALNEGRAMWARMRKSEVMEDILGNVDLRQPDAANTIRSQFASLAANKKRMRGFSADEQAAIREFGEGKATPTVLDILAKLAPGIDLRGFAVGSLLAGGAATGQVPPELALGLGAVGWGARGARNFFAKQGVSNLAAGVRRGDVQAPFAVQPNALVSPISQQFLNQLAAQAGQ